MFQIPKTKILFALAAFTCIGLRDFSGKKGISPSPSPVSYYAVEVLATFTTIILLGCFLEGWRISLNWHIAIYAFLSGVLICVAMVAMLYDLGDVITFKRIAGIALAIAAIYLLST